MILPTAFTIQNLRQRFTFRLWWSRLRQKPSSEWNVFHLDLLQRPRGLNALLVKSMCKSFWRVISKYQSLRILKFFCKLDFSVMWIREGGKIVKFRVGAPLWEILDPSHNPNLFTWHFLHFSRSNFLTHDWMRRACCIIWTFSWEMRSHYDKSSLWLNAKTSWVW